MYQLYYVLPEYGLYKGVDWYRQHERWPRGAVHSSDNT